MRVIVCGGRDHLDSVGVFRQLDAFHAHTPISTLIEGGAKGVDRFAYQWAQERKIPAVRFPAHWEKYGKSAGPRRNMEMLDYPADCVIAFPGGRGTACMVRLAQERGVKVVEVE